MTRSAKPRFIASSDRPRTCVWWWKAPGLSTANSARRDSRAAPRACLLEQRPHVEAIGGIRLRALPPRAAPAFDLEQHPAVAGEPVKQRPAEGDEPFARWGPWSQGWRSMQEGVLELALGLVEQREQQ